MAVISYCYCWNYVVCIHRAKSISLAYQNVWNMVIINAIINAILLYADVVLIIGAVVVIWWIMTGAFRKKDDDNNT